MTTHNININKTEVKANDFIQHESREVQFVRYDDDTGRNLFKRFIDGQECYSFCLSFDDAIEWLKTGKFKGKSF